MEVEDREEEEGRDRDVPERVVRTLLRGTNDRNDDDVYDGGVGVEELYRVTFSYRDHSSYVTDKRQTIHTTLSTCVRLPRPLHHRRQSLCQSPIHLPIRMP